jgi:hypothetical protein
MLVIMKLKNLHMLQIIRIHSFMHSSMDLHSSVGPWHLLQLRNLFWTDGRAPQTRDQPVARPLPIHRLNANTDIHALSGIRTNDPSLRGNEDTSCLRPRGHLDRQITIHNIIIYSSTYPQFVFTKSIRYPSKFSLVYFAPGPACASPQE